MTTKIKENINIIISTDKISSLSPILGQRGIKINEFKDELNKQLADITENILLCLTILIKENRKFSIIVRKIPSQFFFKQLLNKNLASSFAKKQLIGNLDIRYLYEFAKLTANEKTLKSTIKTLIATAKSMGILIKKD